MSTTRASSLQHVRPAQPLEFREQEPDSERLGQGRRHLHLVNALYNMLLRTCVPEHTIGSDQFVYFDAADPTRCLAPDAFVRLNVRDHDFGAYLVWEEGTPAVAFEVLSRDTREPWTLDEKLLRYRSLGVRELVTFHPDALPGERLRVWDRLEHDLVERVVTGDMTPCVTLGLTLLVGPVNEYPVALRLTRDAEGRDLVLTDWEYLRNADQAKALAAAGRAGEAADHDANVAARQRAEERIAELEKELAATDERHEGQ